MVDYHPKDEDYRGGTTTRLEGRSVLVTGGGSGIGRAVSVLSALAGAKVTIADIHEDGARAVASEIADAGGEAQSVRCDVSDEDSIIEAVAQARGTFGHLDGACNAAGMEFKGALTHEIPTDYWDRVSMINLRGIFLSMKHQIAAMLEDNGGSIVNISSTAAVASFPFGADYCATKSGVSGLTRSAALEYAERPIRVNAVLPGSTRTPMLARGMGGMDEAMQEMMVARVPMKRLARPLEMARAVCWLLSDEASFITGVLLPVDGGLTASL